MHYLDLFSRIAICFAPFAGGLGGEEAALVSSKALWFMR